MKVQILFLVMLASCGSATEYYNFMIDESLQNQRADWNGSTYFKGTNEFEMVELDMHESIHIDFVNHRATTPDQNSFSLQGPGSFSSGYWLRTGASVWRFLLRYNDEVWQSITANSDVTLQGPGTVYLVYVFDYRRQDGNVQNAVLGETYITYEYDINTKVRYSLTSNEPEAKFSVSLDNDGDRVAMGYKESGSNALIRVYEFDGSSWNQLGEDIE